MREAAPDGYTICLLAVDTLSYGPYLFKTVPFNPATAFQPITNVFFLTEVMSVNPALKVSTMKELVELSKKDRAGSTMRRPQTASRCSWRSSRRTPARTSPGAVSRRRRCGECGAERRSAGRLLWHGQQRPQPHAGKLKALAVDSPQRSPLLPNVPTFAEEGYTGVLNRAWFGIFAPANTPKAIVTKLHDEIVKIAKAPEFQQKYLTGLGLEPILNTPEEFAAFLEQDRVRAGELVKISGLQPQ